MSRDTVTRTLVWVVCAVILWMPSGLGAQESGEVERYAIFVGANNGGSERVRLRFAEADARKMAGLLTELGGLTPERTMLLIEPDSQALVSALEGLGEWIREGSGGGRTELILYYSGHSDEEGLLLGGERLGYVRLKALVEAAPADVRVVILDSCASGALLTQKGGSKRPPFMMDAASNVRGQALLTSSSAEEAAQESARLGGSFFTHFLSSGLRGAADLNTDGRVSLTEAYQHAFRETLAQTEKTVHGPQHAGFDLQLSGNGELVLTDLSQTSSTLALGADVRGRLFIRDTEGLLVMEMLKAPGRAVSLSLAPGRYHLRLLRGQEAFEGVVELADKGQQTLDLDAMRAVSKEETTARGGEDGDRDALVRALAQTQDREVRKVLLTALSDHRRAKAEAGVSAKRRAKRDSAPFWTLGLDAGLQTHNNGLLPNADISHLGAIFGIGPDTNLSFQLRLRLPTPFSETQTRAFGAGTDDESLTVSERFEYGASDNFVLMIPMTSTLRFGAGLQLGADGVRLETTSSGEKGPQTVEGLQSVWFGGGLVQLGWSPTDWLLLYTEGTAVGAWRQGTRPALVGGESVRTGFEPGLVLGVGLGASLFHRF